MQTPEPPQGYQPGGWQQPNYYQPGPPVPQKPRTQTLNLEYNVAGGLCYLPFLFIHIILPIIFISSEPKTNKFVRFHAFQALFMAITGIVGGVGAYLLMVIGWALVFVLAAATNEPAIAVIGVVITVAFVVGIIAFALFMLISTIIALIKAFSGEMWKVPVVGRFADKYA